MAKTDKTAPPTSEFDLSVGIGTLARDIHRAMSRAIDARVAGYGLTSQTCRYLAILRNKGGATAKEFSDFLNVRSPTTLGALRILEEKRLIKRTNDPSDGRKGIYVLTALGAEVEALVYEAATDVEKRATRRLTARERQLFRKLAHTIHDAILENLDEAPAEVLPAKARRRSRRA